MELVDQFRVVGHNEEVVARYYNDSDASGLSITTYAPVRLCWFVSGILDIFK